MCGCFNATVSKRNRIVWCVKKIYNHLRQHYGVLNQKKSQFFFTSLVKRLKEEYRSKIRNVQNKADVFENRYAFSQITKLLSFYKDKTKLATSCGNDDSKWHSNTKRFWQHRPNQEAMGVVRSHYLQYCLLNNKVSSLLIVRFIFILV